MQVLHKYDVRSCCNPAHLFLGTNADNMADMKSKGRTTTRPKSPREVGPNPGRKLAPDQVQEIRGLKWMFTHSVLGARFGVSRRLIGEIQAGTKWRRWPWPEDVPEPVGWARL